jgi:hypothetical protein
VRRGGRFAACSAFNKPCRCTATMHTQKAVCSYCINIVAWFLYVGLRTLRLHQASEKFEQPVQRLFISLHHHMPINLTLTPPLPQGPSITYKSSSGVLLWARRGFPVRCESEKERKVRHRQQLRAHRERFRPTTSHAPISGGLAPFGDRGAGQT